MAVTVVLLVDMAELMVELMVDMVLDAVVGRKIKDSKLYA
jgi:hypothetical protein